MQQVTQLVFDGTGFRVSWSLCSNRMGTTSSLSMFPPLTPPPQTGAWTTDFRQVKVALLPFCIMLHMWLPFPVVIQIGHFLPLCTIHKHKLITKSLGQFTCREVPIAYDLWPYPSDYSHSGTFQIISKSIICLWVFWFYFILVLGLKQIWVLVFKGCWPMIV